MIQLIVLTLRGTPLPHTLAGVFGPAGGTLGRSPSNTLVLDDPDRTVSRVHAQLVCRDGAFFAVDRGRNPMQHNGRTVGSGNEVPLSDGDRLLVGGFEVEVKAFNTAATAHAGAAAPDASSDPLLPDPSAAACALLEPPDVPITARASDPLAFSPTAETARVDLRAYRFGVRVGMQTALAHLIARFAPAELEKEIASRSATGGLSAASRTAELWDRFVALYGGIATDAEADFHSRFGKAFVETYDAQIKQLKAEAPRRTEGE
jgi:FHA domain-containing protein